MLSICLLAKQFVSRGMKETKENMMKWENTKEIMVEKIIETIKSSILLDESGNLAIMLNHFSQYSIPLIHCIKWSRKINSEEKFQIVNSSILKMILDNKKCIENITSDVVLQYIKTNIGKYWQNYSSEKEFILASSLSMKYSTYFSNLCIDSCKIYFERWPITQVEYDQGTLQYHQYYLRDPSSYSDYCGIKLQITSNSPSDALLKTHQYFDYIRGLLNLSIEKIRYPCKYPLNEIIYGPLTVLLNKDETVAHKDIRDPIYETAVRCVDITNVIYPDGKRDYDRFLNLFDTIESKLHNISISDRDKIRNLISKYAQALDSPSAHFTYLQLWGLLENLTIPININDKSAVINRACTFLQNQDFHKFNVELLKNYRNSWTHDANRSTNHSNEVDNYVKNLQMYVKLLLRVFLDNLGYTHNTLDDFYHVLETATTIDELRRKISNILTVIEKL